MANSIAVRQAKAAAEAARAAHDVLMRGGAADTPTAPTTDAALLYLAEAVESLGLAIAALGQEQPSLPQ